MVTLWDLLSVVCAVMPIGSALAVAKHARAGFGGYALTAVVGLSLGACFTWTMRAGAAALAKGIQRQPVTRQERYFGALYFAAILWRIVADFLGAWLSWALLRLVP